MSDQLRVESALWVAEKLAALPADSKLMFYQDAAKNFLTLSSTKMEAAVVYNHFSLGPRWSAQDMEILYHLFADGPNENLSAFAHLLEREASSVATFREAYLAHSWAALQSPLEKKETFSLLIERSENRRLQCIKKLYKNHLDQVREFVLFSGENKNDFVSKNTVTLNPPGRNAQALTLDTKDLVFVATFGPFSTSSSSSQFEHELKNRYRRHATLKDYGRFEVFRAKNFSFGLLNHEPNFFFTTSSAGGVFETAESVAKLFELHMRPSASSFPTPESALKKAIRSHDALRLS